MSLRGELQLPLQSFALQTGDFQLPERGLTAIFGRSGSGKTTLLRCIAGLEPNVEGKLSFAGRTWLDAHTQLPVHQRKLGYVFQEASLFPHLNVEQNLRYGLKRHNVKRDGPVTMSYDSVVDWLGLTSLCQRTVDTLSGGERQRVAIGRTLLAQPKILLMDEPMASLDVFTKRAIMPYLERLRDELAIPILYVTHSPDEVERLADHVLFMEQGRIVGIDPLKLALKKPDTPLYQEDNPRSVLLANVVEAEAEDSLSHVTVGQSSFWVPRIPIVTASTVRIVISAQQVSLLAGTPEKCSVLNHVPVEITAMEMVNEYSVLIHLAIEGTEWPLLAQVTKRSYKLLGLEVGQKWIAAIKSASILS